MLLDAPDLRHVLVALLKGRWGRSLREERGCQEVEHRATLALQPADSDPQASAAALHGRELVIPYAMSDYASTFATVPLDDVLNAMTWA